MTTFSTEGFQTAIIDSFDDIFNAIKAYFFGASADEQKQQATTKVGELSTRKENLQSREQEISRQIDIIPSGATEQIQQLEAEREAIRTQSNNLASEIGNLETQLAGSFEDIPGVASDAMASIIPAILGGIGNTLSTGISDLFSGNITTSAMVTAIAGLWAAPKVINAIGGITDLFRGSDRGRGRDRGADIDSDSDRNRRKGRLKLPGGIKGAGALGALFGAIELGSVLTDDTLTKDEKIEQGAGAAGGMAGGMAGAAAGAALGSVVPIVGTAIGGLIGGSLGYFGGDVLGSAVGESITGGSEEISEEQINDQASQLKSLQSLANIDLDQTAIEKNLNALRLYAEGMNQIPSIQSAGVFETLKANIVSFVGGDDNPFAPLVAFSNLTLGTKSVDNLISVRLFAEAMNLLPEVQQPGVFETLKASIVSFVGGDNDAFAPLVAFSNLTLGTKSVDNLISVRLFAEAMNLLPEVDAEKAGGFFESIRSLFGGNTVMPWDQVREFGEVDINVESVTANAAAMKAFGNALSGFSNFETSELDLPDRFTNNLVEISNITGTGLQNIATGLESIVGVTGVRDQLDAINEGLDPAGIRTYTDAIDQLVEKLNELNEVLAESNDTLFKDNQSAADVLGNIKVSTQGSSEGISQLNTMLSQMLTVLTQSKEIENKIERNTASLSSDTLSGRVSRMR